MPRTSTLWFSTAAAFAGGLFSGLLVAPTSGREFRQRIVECTQTQGAWVERRLQRIETQLSALEDQMQTTTTAFSERFREVTGRALDAYVPTMPESSWAVEKGELARELRFMPRK